MRELFVAGALLLGGACPAMAGPARMAPGYTFADTFGFWSGPLRDRIDREADALDSLPHWTHGFDVAGEHYRYTLLGSDPAQGPAVTVIPTVLVPLRITVAPDAAGRQVVFDATPIIRKVVQSPIFTPAKFASGTLQFTDAMLRMEFPSAPKGWHLVLSPSVAATVDIQATRDQVQIMHAKSGETLGVITDGRLLGQAIGGWARHNFSQHIHPIFISYNSLAGGAFGFHSAIAGPARGQMMIFTYTSWLEGAGAAFGIASPNSDTLAHEEAEVVHDAFGTSITKKWGDWFRENKCFQRYIEVGDAVEDASGRVQNWKQSVTVNGRQEVFTLQTEALLPWFERKYPSPALHGAYSFPSETALLGPAPIDCED